MCKNVTDPISCDLAPYTCDAEEVEKCELYFFNFITAVEYGAQYGY